MLMKCLEYGLFLAQPVADLVSARVFIVIRIAVQRPARHRVSYISVQPFPAGIAKMAVPDENAARFARVGHVRSIHQRNASFADPTRDLLDADVHVFG